MAEVAISEKKKQKKYKKEVVAALKEMIQQIKNSDVEDVELQVDQTCPPFGTFADNCGVMQTVCGSIVINEIRLTFKTIPKES